MSIPICCDHILRSSIVTTNCARWSDCAANMGWMPRLWSAPTTEPPSNKFIQNI